MPVTAARAAQWAVPALALKLLHVAPLGDALEALGNGTLHIAAASHPQDLL
jgi:hypothetical protein